MGVLHISINHAKMTSSTKTRVTSLVVSTSTSMHNSTFEFLLSLHLDKYNMVFSKNSSFRDFSSTCFRFQYLWSRYLKNGSDGIKIWNFGFNKDTNAPKRFWWKSYTRKCKKIWKKSAVLDVGYDFLKSHFFFTFHRKQSFCVRYLKNRLQY